MKIHVRSAEELRELGQSLARRLRGGEVIGLVGELGAGKTTFVQGMAVGLGIEQEVISPTFVLERRYPIGTADEGELVHVDFYRMKELAEAQSIGLRESMTDPRSIVVIEWADRFAQLLPEERLIISFTEDGTGRLVQFEARGVRYDELLAGMKR